MCEYDFNQCHTHILYIPIIHSTNILCKIEFYCEHHVSRSSNKVFEVDKLQQTGTIVMKKVMPPSRKDKTSSTYNEIASMDPPRNKEGLVKSLDNGRKPGQRN